MCIHSLLTESAHEGHDVSQHKANQWHQRGHGQNVRCEDCPQHVFDEEATQDGHYDAGDDQDAETGLSTEWKHQAPTCLRWKKAYLHRTVFTWSTLQGPHLFHECGVLRLVVINGDANGARHQGERKRSHDFAVRHSFFQTAESLAEDIEQQRHQTQGGDVGASGHRNAGKVSEAEKDVIRVT